MALGLQQMNKTLADSLCTVIAVGYLYIDRNNPYRMNFLFENDPNNNAYFDHDALRELFHSKGVEDYFPTFEPQDNKHDFPFIIARPNDMDSVIDHIRISESLSGQIQVLEDFCNGVFDAPDDKLPGAYIGGTAKENELRLLFPSLLYRYPLPPYICTQINNNGGFNYLNDISVKYNSFRAVTEKILNLFFSLENENGIMQLPGAPNIIFWAMSRDLTVLVNRMPQAVGNGMLFGSVHGLVTSMTEAPHDTLEEGNCNVELALGKDTCKAASCMPCSIFASSQGAPPSYTHFGRGDYWNLPLNCPNEIREGWENYVNQCYERGIDLLAGMFPAEWTDFYARLSMELYGGDLSYIPNAFLSALTFEGSFAGKMTRTFESFV